MPNSLLRKMIRRKLKENLDNLLAIRIIRSFMKNSRKRKGEIRDGTDYDGDATIFTTI